MFVKKHFQKKVEEKLKIKILLLLSNIVMHKKSEWERYSN